MPDDQRARFLPFIAINEFMRDDYRLAVVREVLQALAGLPSNYKGRIESMIRKSVTVPGFRNSAKAPAPLLLKSTAEAFTKNAPLVAVILSAWAEMHADLRQQVYDLLVERNWGVYPPDADRTRLPGFMITWPKDEDFSIVNEAFTAKYPDQPGNTDDISLMVVWVSTRLPYQIGEE